MAGLLGLVIFVLDVMAIVDCVKSGKDADKKALWIILILILPAAGLVLYYLLGKKSNA